MDAAWQYATRKRVEFAIRDWQKAQRIYVPKEALDDLLNRFESAMRDAVELGKKQNKPPQLGRCFCGHRGPLTEFIEEEVAHTAGCAGVDCEDDECKCVCHFRQEDVDGG